MKMNETVAGLTITAKTEGVDQAKKQVDALTQSTQQLGVVAEQSSKGAISLETQWKRATLRFDEAARAQANIERETVLANKAVAQGVATQQQANEHIARVTQRYSEMGKSGEQAAKGTGLARHELINLGRQAQDVGVSLASGQSPLMVLVQQGTQIADVFATSAGGLRGFFTQAIGWGKQFLMSTGGIVTAVLAIGGAAIYAASQFVRAQSTVEEALKEQIRLEKEIKTLIDARASAEAKAQAQLRGQTEFETKRNLLDLQLKLNKAMEDAIKLAERRSTTPTQVPGEMGEAPTAYAPLKDPGMDKITAAFERMKAAQAAGLPGLREYNAELGRIGDAHPALAQIVEDMIKANKEGFEIEKQTLRARAWADALAGVATNAQLLAVGLGSIAQFKLSNLQADQAAAATERMAVATLKMAERYPGMSIEVGKTLAGLNDQLGVAQAINVHDELAAQHTATKNQLLREGKTLEEAIAVANAQQAIAYAKIDAAHQQRMIALREELSIAQHVTGLGAMQQTRLVDIARLQREGLTYVQALAEANIKYEISLTRVNVAAEQRLRQLENEGQLIRANSAEERERIKSAQTYTQLLEDGVEKRRAAAIAGQQEANEREQREQQEAEASKRAIANIRTAGDAWKAYEDDVISWSVAHDHAIERTLAMEEAINSNSIAMARAAQSAAFWGTTMAEQIEKTMNLLPSQFGDKQYTSTWDPLNLQGQKQQLEAQIKRQGYGTLEEVSQGVGFGGFTSYRIKDDMSLAERNKQQWEKLQEAMGLNTDATKENTAATQTMTDVLSPFYSSDPRRTHLGFRAFAGGGIMTAHGELPLKQYQGGGVATSPQVAVYGEGSTPEAYVPVPSGRIPVEIKQPANSNQRPVNVTINVMGNADANTVAALKATAFQQAQAMRRAMV